MSQLGGGANVIGGAILAVRASQDQLAADMARIRSYFEGQVKRLQERSRVSLSATLASGLTGAAGVGLAGAGGMTAAMAMGSKVAADFEQKMVDAATTFEIFDKQSASFQKLQASAIELGASTRFSASEVAEAYESLGQSGFNATQALAAMPNVLGLAAASGMRVADAAEIAASTMKNFGLAATDLERVNDALAMTANKSGANMSDLSFTLKYAAPIAASTGTELEDLLAVIGRMADAGIKGEMAGTSLRAMLNSLSSPTKAAREEFERFGIDVERFGKAGGPGLLDVLERLQQRGAGAGSIKTMFSAESMSGILGLMRTSRGEDSARALADAMRSPAAQGSARAMAKARMDTAKGDFEQMKGSLESLSIAVFQPINQNLFRPAIAAATDYFEGLSREAMASQDKIARWAAQVKSILGDIGGGLAGAGQQGLAGLGGIPGMEGMSLDKIESVTANWGLAWEKLKIKARLAMLGINAFFTEMLTAMGESAALFGTSISDTFSEAFNPDNWFGKGDLTGKLKSIWGEQFQAKLKDGRMNVRAAGDAVRAEEGPLRAAEARIDQMQDEEMAKRFIERMQPALADFWKKMNNAGVVDPAIEGKAKGAWGNLFQPFAGGQAGEAKKEQRMAFAGLAEMSKKIQQGLTGGTVTDIAKKQLDEQKKVNKNLKDLPEKIGEEIGKQPAVLG